MNELPNELPREALVVGKAKRKIEKAELALAKLVTLLSSIDSNLSKDNPDHAAIIRGLDYCAVKLQEHTERFRYCNSELKRYYNVREKNLADAVAEVRAKETSNKNRFNLRWSYELSQTNQEK